MTDSRYDSLPKHLTAWIHTPDNQWYYDKYGLDASECVEGWLYLFDRDTGKPTLICGEKVSLFDANYEHIYYVTEQDPQTVVRVNLKGEEKVAYPMGGTVTRLDYFGGINGELGIVENQADVVIYDLTENSRTVIFTYHDIKGITFDPWKDGIIEISVFKEGSFTVNLKTGEMIPLL